jgi:glycosyltransferase involved in cell wall biosynthesis/GT2 family glycosyltransferase
MQPQQRVSIIINTDGRRDSLETTLKSLRHLNYKNFEACVVAGPTQDGTRELLLDWSKHVKVDYCDTRNLSRSRNIGLLLASGEIVAFLDDDSIPEPEWLDKVTGQFSDPLVAASGGFLLDHTGRQYQWKYGTVNRFGSADNNWERAAPEFNFPFTANFPHVMANSAFRKEAIAEVGGFDEQYIYFLDETDLICRLVDQGYHISQVDGAPVHHKYKPSHIRSEARVLTSWKVIVRSKIYFALMNAQGHHGTAEAVQASNGFIQQLREGLEWHIAEGRASPDLREKFEFECEEGLRDGIKAALHEGRILIDPSLLKRCGSPFLRFDTLTKENNDDCICLLTKNFPPAPIGGIGRYVHQLAGSLATAGNQVHILTEGEHDSTDFEDGVWVHRLKRVHQPMNYLAKGFSIPQQIWDYSAAMFCEVEKIAKERKVLAVLAPIWDCEGIAFIIDRRWPIVVSLHTTMKFYLDAHSHLKQDKHFMSNFGGPLIDLERKVMREADGIIANSSAIIREIEAAYSTKFDYQKTTIVPHGQDDWTISPRIPPQALPESALRIVFVGRLEERKGVDILLSALERILPLRKHVFVDLVGNDKHESPRGLTYREEWDRCVGRHEFHSRVRFHGEVSDERLRGYYAGADIFVAPSRFESFGLILVEAMMFGKAVIGTQSGGMPEVVSDGISGLLAEPGNVDSLVHALIKLIDDEELRCRLGHAARAEYLSKFTAGTMAHNVNRFLLQIGSTSDSAGSNR